MASGCPTSVSGINATPEQDEGDGDTPRTPTKACAASSKQSTAAGTRERDGGWLGGIRGYIPDTGLVPSSRFLRAHPSVTGSARPNAIL